MNLLSNPAVATAAALAVLSILVFFADVLMLATGTCKSPKSSAIRMTLSAVVFSLGVVFLVLP